MAKTAAQKQPITLDTITIGNATILVVRLYFGKFSWRCERPTGTEFGAWFATEQEARDDAADYAEWLRVNS